jgi:hypothetical protein
MAIKPPFPQNAQVEHPKFGFGTVMSSNEEHIVIKFDDHGEKKFVTPIVFPNLKKSDRQPPPEKRGSRTRKPKLAKAAPAMAG